jgi:hypothetical protein
MENKVSFLCSQDKYLTFENFVHTSQKTHYLFITREVVALYADSHMKHNYIICIECAVFKVGRTYNNQLWFR